MQMLKQYSPCWILIANVHSVKAHVSLSRMDIKTEKSLRRIDRCNLSLLCLIGFNSSEIQHAWTKDRENQ